MRGFSQKALSSFDLTDVKVIEARGEDIPFWVEQLSKKGKKAIGIVGEDLYSEYCIGKQQIIKVLKRIQWDEPNAVFGKPALCLIGPKQKEFKFLPKQLKICISSKYKKIAERYLKTVEDRGFSITKFYANGCLEPVCYEGIADMIVDIVYTGSSLKKYNLKIYGLIMKSDLLVIGGKND
ncbi:hypothetical protein ACFL6I_09265 [candidate division KSB1 bacterium]